ncbi:hypothetical protein MTR67_015793 [Solanum verrucosum]|uniref:RWD domain-containing protein n=1 Tax=Solanum verrucosum TaxID=315347 RepID=A0AAF0QFW4_SOLVR|nr:hypothetical protein MTR67_015793 [Solanum verrucosum]
MTDYVQEQEMEIEALEAILMDEFKEIHSSESGLNTSNRCFQITISPQEEDEEFTQSSGFAIFTVISSAALFFTYVSSIRLALIFSHTEKYPDEPPLLNVSSLKGIHSGDLKILKEKLEQEAVENLGMAMIYTLVSSAKDWLSERFAQETDEGVEDDEAKKEEVIVPHGEAVTVETFLAWRERFEAELALERAKLMPDAALSVSKEKKLTGRQWFESGRASGKAATATAEESDEDVDDIDFDDDDFEDDEEEDMLEHYLAEKTDSSSHS